MKTIVKIIFTAIVSAALLCGCNTTTENPTSKVESSDTISVVSTPNSIVSEIESSAATESSITENSVINKPESSVISVEPSVETSVETSTETSVETSTETSVETSSIVPDEFDFSNKYFVNKLDERMLKNFTDTYCAVSYFKNSVTFENQITSDELDTIMFLLNYDCPELIQISGDYFPEYTDSERNIVSGVSFSYIMNESQYKKANNKLNSFFTKLKKNIGKKTELEKEKYIYDYIFNNCIYNETDTMSGSVYGALIKGKGRCEAICKSFMWCMRELGIECMCVSGEQNWNPDSLYASHSWNIVKINGEYYHLDITVDCIPLENEEKRPANYGFFNVDDEYISSGRTINKIFTSLGVPKCTSLKDNYHIMNGLYIDGKTNIEQNFYNILSENFNNGLDDISIKFKNTSDFELMTENCDNWILNFLNSASDEPFDYLYNYYDFSNTITIHAEKHE